MVGDKSCSMAACTINTSVDHRVVFDSVGQRSAAVDTIRKHSAGFLFCYTTNEQHIRAFSNSLCARSLQAVHLALPLLGYDHHSTFPSLQLLNLPLTILTILSIEEA